jgi:hypothetical protein
MTNTMDHKVQMSTTDGYRVLHGHGLLNMHLRYFTSGLRNYWNEVVGFIYFFFHGNEYSSGYDILSLQMCTVLLHTLH